VLHAEKLVQFQELTIYFDKAACPHEMSRRLQGKFLCNFYVWGSLLKLLTHSYFSENKSDEMADNLHEDLLTFIISSGYWSL
jgi:hypothetical protein